MTTCALVERILEAAMEDPDPSPDLAAALDAYLDAEEARSDPEVAAPRQEAAA